MPDYDQWADYSFFKDKLSDLIEEHTGEFVVIHDREIKEFFGNKLQAIRFAERTFGPGRLIVQEIQVQKARPYPYSLLV